MMCAAVDTLASQHYFYGHSPPAGFLADYGVPALQAPARRTFAKGRSAPVLSPHLKTIKLEFGSTPRSILRGHNGAKKSVAFADDCGYALEQIRVMSEPSHVPPYWIVKPEVRRESKQDGRNKTDFVVTDRWECRFAQPASDYVGFRNRITDENVSLENVIIKECEGVIEGTVKVKNIDYDKQVFVRSTADGWSSHEDTYCAFSECGPCVGGVISLYDTFAFRIQLPIHSRRMEFCVCFTCKGEEFWDSNKGQNYCIERKSVRSVASPTSFCGGFHSGNSWSARTDNTGNTPYW